MWPRRLGSEDTKRLPPPEGEDDGSLRDRLTRGERPEGQSRIRVHVPPPTLGLVPDTRQISGACYGRFGSGSAL
jgi:hypothetical protein